MATTGFIVSPAEQPPQPKGRQPIRRPTHTERLLAAAAAADDPANCIDVTGLTWAEQRKSLLGE